MLPWLLLLLKGFPEMVLALCRRYNSICGDGELVGSSGHLFHESRPAKVWVLTALGRVSIWDGQHVCTSITYVVGITVNDVAFMKRCG